MSNLQLQSLVLLLLFYFIEGKGVCKFYDEVCMTRAAKRSLKSLVAGIEGKFDSSDPLHYGPLEGEVAGLQYNIYNGTLIGMSGCDVTRLWSSPEQFYYEYFLQCPKLIFKAKYKVKGVLGAYKLNGEGTSIMTAEDYVVEYRGQYREFLDKEVKTKHVCVDDFYIQSYPKGKVTFEPASLPLDFEDTCNQSSMPGENFLNDNWQEMEIMFREILHIILRKVLYNINEVMKTWTLEKLLPETFDD